MKNYDIAAYIWPSYTGKEPRVEGQILPHKPLWETVDEADPKVMEFQIKEALRHGVNTFIYGYGYLEAVRDVFKNE